MKNYITRVLLLLFTVGIYAQQGINYKAIIKGGSGNILVSSPVSVRFTIYEGAALTNNVYQETHTPTTDANGLIVINIGEGTTGVIGVFNTINWGSDDHFLNTKINTGTGIVDLGTKEFKTVPYALYAETAGSATEVQTLADVLALGNSAGGVLRNLTNPTQAQDAVTKDYTDNTTGLAETSLQTQITDLQDQIAGFEAQIIELTPANIGDIRNGGVVFWVDPADNTHGMACAFSDHVTGIQWSNGTNITTGATATALGTGSANTAAILSAQGSPFSNYAAGVARLMPSGGSDLWSLPSKDELDEMHRYRANIDQVAIANGGEELYGPTYWSSSETSIDGAWAHNFIGGIQFPSLKSNHFRVRAVIPF